MDNEDQGKEVLGKLYVGMSFRQLLDAVWLCDREARKHLFSLLEDEILEILKKVSWRLFPQRKQRNPDIEQDFVADTFVKLVEMQHKGGPHREPGYSGSTAQDKPKFLAWIRCCASCLLRRYKVPGEEEQVAPEGTEVGPKDDGQQAMKDPLPASQPNVEDNLVVQNICDLARAVAREMPKAERQVSEYVVTHFQAKYDFAAPMPEDIAKALGITPGKAQQYRSRFMRRLREELSKKHPEYRAWLKDD